MRILAISSQKGGVGKTTVSINTAYAFARSGKKVLLVDVDPQGSVGLSLSRKSSMIKGIYDYIMEPSLRIEQIIVPTRMDTMSIVTAGQDSLAGITAAVEPHSAARLREFFRKAELLGYDMCIVDTAAGLFGFSAEVLNYAHAVMAPQQCEPLGIRSIPKMLEAILKKREENPRLKVLGVLLTMVQPQLEESVESARGIMKLLPPDLVFDTQIPRNDLFVKASAKGLPVSVIPEAVSLGLIFDSLVREIEKKLNDYPN